MTKKRYAFWPNHYAKLSDGQMVFRWNFYAVEPDVAATCGVEYEEVSEDDSRVGTKLKSIFRSFGFNPGTCQCDSIAHMMNDASLEFLTKHIDGLVDLIKYSAAQLHVSAPAMVLKPLVRFAIHKEKRRIANGNNHFSPAE